MTARRLTHVWLEAPLLAATVAGFPAGVELLPALPPPETPWSNGRPAQAIVASSLLRYSAEVLEGFPALQMIARTGIGVDNIDLAAATRRGVVVTNTPDGPTESTAEHTVAMLLALAKRLKQGNDNLAGGHWGPRRGALVGTEVRGKTLGLIGLGRIGRRVAEICRLAFSMRVIAYDPFVTAEDAASLGAELADLPTVLHVADFVSLHAPATADTIRLLNAERLAWMKEGSYLLNMARGSLVDEDALLRALEAGHLAGAGLDVFDPEPPEVGNGLRAHPSVIATPHMASLTAEGRERMEQMALERLLDFFTGVRPDNVVNPEAYPNVEESK